MPKTFIDVEYSVFINVCSSDTPNGFSKAFQSIVSQQPPPSQIVVCADGIDGELLRCVSETEKYADVVYVASNGDHAIARAAALAACKYDIVGVMDADDIACADRFKTLITLLFENRADVAGGAIREFDKETGREANIRRLPTEDKQIKKYLKRRCPFNHMTVVYKKSAVVKSGGYKTLYCNEDYYLWVRMAQNGCVFVNTEDVVCLAGVSEASYDRRGGAEYYESEKTLQKYMLDNGMISHFRYAFNVAVRYVLQRMMTSSMRKTVYNTFLRRKR